MIERSRPPRQLLQPGSNCWTVEHADRFHVIQDGEYYRLVRDAILRAQRTVFILAWDVNARVELVPGERSGAMPSRLDRLLIHAARRRPHVRFFILTWDYGLLFALERDPFTRWRLGWRTPSNIRLAFDDHHPIGACHHQKVVVVDDTLAFSGSMDLTGHRWDTSAHRPDEPGRVNPFGRPYGPYHEVMAMLEGAAAARLGELARERWRAVGVTRVPSVKPAATSLWPEPVAPDCTDVDVGIARTMPGTPARPAVRECEQLYLDAIAAATRTIYLENQYFTHPGLADALAARLREPDGPEVVLVLPLGGDGWLEEQTIQVIRDSLFQRLVAADRRGRLRIVHPSASRCREVETFVHSKVLVVDDTLLIVGSANTNRRSMGMDTECDIALAGATGRTAAAIAGIRHRLLAEHLQLTPGQVERAIADTGSMRQLIDARQQEDHTLVPFELAAAPIEPLDDTVQDVIDPEAPFRLGEEIGQLPPIPDTAPIRLPLPVWVAPGVAALGAAIVARAWFATHDQSLLPALQEVIETSRTMPLAETPLPLALALVLLAAMRMELGVIAAGALLGTGRGTLVATGAAVALAAAGYALGRWLGMQGAGRWMPRRSFLSISQLDAASVGEVAMLRLAGVGGARAVHLLSGARRAPFAAHLAGTLLGLAPAIGALTALGSLLGRLILMPTVAYAVTTAAAALVVFACALALRVLLQIRQFAPAMARHRAQAEAG